VKDKIEGKAEELKGKVTGDRGTELKGKARQAAGEAKRLARDLGVAPGARREAEPAEEPEHEPEKQEEARPTRPSDP
jgi:phage terminase small subunit